MANEGKIAVHHRFYIWLILAKNIRSRHIATLWLVHYDIMLLKWARSLAALCQLNVYVCMRYTVCTRTRAACVYWWCVAIVCTVNSIVCLPSYRSCFEPFRHSYRQKAPKRHTRSAKACTLPSTCFAIAETCYFMFNAFHGVCIWFRECTISIHGANAIKGKHFNQSKPNRFVSIQV